MTVLNTNSHILPPRLDNSIGSQSNLPQNKLVICVSLDVENGMSSLNDCGTLS